MKQALIRFSLLPILATFVISGCATTRPKRVDAQDPNAQINALQSELMAKDQQIQDLQYQLNNAQAPVPSTNFTSGSSSDSSDKYNLLRVSGVSGMDVQKALRRAGFDPGPIDGRLGKKTRSAIKAFQKQQGLTADGIIGEKTWSSLRSA